MRLAAHAKNRNLLNGSIVTGGTTNAQTFTSGVSYTVIPTGLQVLLKIGPTLSSIAGTVTTLNMDGIGAVGIKTQKGDDVTSGLIAGTYANFLYNGTNWVWLDSGIGNTTVVITNIIISSVTTGPIALVDFTNLDSSKFARYSVVITNFMPEIDGATLNLSVSIDNGVTFPIDVNDYTVVESYMSAQRIDDGGPFVTAVEYARTYQSLCWGIGSTTPQYPASILLDLFNFKTGVSPTYKWDGASYDPVVEGACMDGGWGSVITRTGCNAIRLWPSSGNIVSGNFTLYGSN